MPTKNLRQGRIDIEDGSTVKLTKTAAFTEGDFTYTRTKNTIQVKNRGILDHLRKGDEEAITFSFSAKFTDKTLQRTLDEFIFDGKTKNITGLTPQTNNQNIALDYAYEQDSLAAAAGDAIQTKLANGTAPTGDGEFSEEIKTKDDLEDVAMVGDSEVTAGAVLGEISVQPGAGDTDFDVVYDAIGRSTFDPGASDVKTLTIKLIKLKPEDLTAINETYTLNKVFLETVEQAEGDEFDVVTFSGVAYVKKPVIT